MEAGTKTEKRRIIFLLTICIFLSATMFAQVHNKSADQSNAEKAYCIFDSAENYFIDILNSKTEQPTGFIIDSRSIGCCHEYVSFCHLNNWRVGIVYASDWQDCPDIFDILKRTKRTIKIGGKNYPVAQMWFDDVFVYNKKKKKTHREYTWEDCLRKSPSIIANMSMHTFYLCPYPSEK